MVQMNSNLVCMLQMAKLQDALRRFLNLVLEAENYLGYQDLNYPSKNCSQFFRVFLFLVLLALLALLKH